ncbi:MAG TPA: cysteine hydrolase family protein [Puia sp.]|nr:cysteine hydrolase family protein [Puia sp.]
MNHELPVAPALILIDIQKGFDQLDAFGGERNNPDAEKVAGRLLQSWRGQKWPVFHIRHCSVKPGSPLAAGQPGNEFKEEVTPLPGEPIIQKSVNSAFIGTDLKERLDAQGIKTVVIVGLITQHCVSTTARMAGNYGYQTYVVSDATAAFRSKGIDGQLYPPELVHQVSLATIYPEFAQVMPAAALMDLLISR